MTHRCVTCRIAVVPRPGAVCVECRDRRLDELRMQGQNKMSNGEVNGYRRLRPAKHDSVRWFK